jgi:hypothetical protein
MPSLAKCSEAPHQFIPHAEEDPPVPLHFRGHLPEHLKERALEHTRPPAPAISDQPLPSAPATPLVAQSTPPDPPRKLTEPLAQ